MAKVTIYTDGGYSRKILAGASAFALVGMNDEVLMTESYLMTLNSKLSLLVRIMEYWT